MIRLECIQVSNFLIVYIYIVYTFVDNGPTKSPKHTFLVQFSMPCEVCWELGLWNFGISYKIMALFVCKVQREQKLLQKSRKIMKMLPFLI